MLRKISPLTNAINYSLLDCSQFSILIFRKIVEIERFALRQPSV